MSSKSGGVARSLRVAAIWGETVLGSTVLRPGDVFTWASIGVSPPEHVPNDPVHGNAGAWELNPAGAIKGYLRMRGRDEDVAEIARIGAPVALMPGDVALLQYGAFALFAQPVAEAPKLAGGARLDLWTAMAVLLSLFGHAGGLYAMWLLSTPLPIPEPLELLSDRKLRDQLHVRELDDEKEKPKGGDESSGKEAGQEKKDSGSSKKIAGTAGKLGRHDGKAQSTQLPGEHAGIPAGSISDVIGSGAGQSLTDTLASMKSVSAITGGLNAKDMAFSDGSGFAFKGGGSGGGGTGPGGAPYGAGNFGTGVAGSGSGSGGKGGKGGTGGGTGGGAPGEKKISVVSGSGGGSKNFSAEEIRRVVMSHTGQIRSCYDAVAETTPGLKGSVTVGWHIAGSGGVPRATIMSSSLNNGRVEGCVTRVIKGWTFKNPEAVEADASWSFTFSPPK